MADLAFAGYQNKQMDSNPISALFGKVGASVKHFELTRPLGTNPVLLFWVRDCDLRSFVNLGFLVSDSHGNTTLSVSVPSLAPAMHNGQPALHSPDTRDLIACPGRGIHPTATNTAVGAVIEPW